MATTKQDIPEGATIRQMTICKKRCARESNRYIYFPELRLQGKWLRQTGFSIGQVIDIMCEEGRITITLARKQRFSDSERARHARGGF